MHVSHCDIREPDDDCSLSKSTVHWDSPLKQLPQDIQAPLGDCDGLGEICGPLCGPLEKDK